jgi:hypothetical protein
VTELEVLRRRRELVLLSAQLQRATIARRLEHLRQNPVRNVLGFASSAASLPLLWKFGPRLLGLAVRAYRRRSLRRRHFAT